MVKVNIYSGADVCSAGGGGAGFTVAGSAVSAGVSFKLIVIAEAGRALVLVFNYIAG
jgi:hypothetical protein